MMLLAVCIILVVATRTLLGLESEVANPKLDTNQEANLYHSLSLRALLWCTYKE